MCMYIGKINKQTHVYAGSLFPLHSVQKMCALHSKAISGHHTRRWFNPLCLGVSRLDGHYRQYVEHQLNRLWLWVWNAFDSGFVTVLEFLHSHLLHWYRVNEALGSLWMPATLCVDSNLLLNKSDSHSYSCVVEKLKMTAMYAFAKRNNWTTYVV